MALALVSANHQHIALADIDRLSAAGADHLRAVIADHAGTSAGSLDTTADCRISGAVVLATCNRLEIYLDAADPATAADHARRAVARASGLGAAEVARLTVALEDEAATHHLFEVAGGLGSMVVGEREIAGQVRRALDAARAAGLATPLLERTFQHASRTSREIAVGTDVSGASVASVALDLVGPDLPAARVLLVGTGSYAGVALAALRDRGAGEVMVWSASGRAEQFAASHGTVPVADLGAALARADLVICCRGSGTVTLDAAAVAASRTDRSAPLTIVDLALRPDVDPAVGELAGVRLVDLATVRRHVPATTTAEVSRARDIVDRGVARLGEDLAGREIDQAVVALRRRVEAAVAEEIGRLPVGGQLPAEDAARAMRRLAARLLHTPTVHARAAAREGRAAEHVQALEQALGLSVPQRP